MEPIQLLGESTTCPGHCRSAQFTYALFLLLQGLTWSTVAVPKRSVVFQHSKKEFYDANLHNAKKDNADDKKNQVMKAMVLIVNNNLLR